MLGTALAFAPKQRHRKRSDICGWKRCNAMGSLNSRSCRLPKSFNRLADIPLCWRKRHDSNCAGGGSPPRCRLVHFEINCSQQLSRRDREWQSVQCKSRATLIGDGIKIQCVQVTCTGGVSPRTQRRLWMAHLPFSLMLNRANCWTSVVTRRANRTGGIYSGGTP